MAILKRGAAQAVHDAFDTVEDWTESATTGVMRRLSLQAINFIAATGANAASSEQAVTANGLRVGDEIAGVLSINTTGGNAVWARTHFRSPVVAINTLNQLTTNHVGESIVIVQLPRTAL